MINGANVVTNKIITQWNQDLLFGILDMISDVVLVTDIDSTIVYANQAYATILGVPVHKVLGRRLDTIELGEDVMEIYRVVRAGRILRNRRTYLTSVGIDVVGNVFPFYEGNNMIGSVAVFNNVSEVVRLTQELQRTKGVADYLQEQLNSKDPLPLAFSEYIGQNSRLRETLRFAVKVASTDSTVLIRGESGVGKEVLAKAIHNCSRRHSKPLIKVNCAAIPETLLESELFGYEEGAFSGAKKGGKLGKFELAHEGTIFLDEIGDMSITMQAKLLRVLQEREFERVGGNKTIKVDIRVIAATNRDLYKMMEQETFRRDLYYRINIVPLFLPPLRERKDDISALGQHFLSNFSRLFNKSFSVSQETAEILYNYDWPGNIRELQSVFEHACIRCGENIIEPHHLPTYIQLKQSDLRLPKQKVEHSIKDAVEKLEVELIKLALESCNYNKSKALRSLGISRKAFYDKLHKYNLY